MGCVPAERSLSISFEPARDCLLMDSATAAALCLVSPGGSSGGTSLFRVLAPGARTDAGRSLLRASLLQPLAHAPTIAARHEAVAELASEAATATMGGEATGGGGGGNNSFVATAGPRGDAVSRALRALPRDLDKALGILSLRPCRAAGGGGGGNGGGSSNTADLDSSSSARATAAAASRVDSLARGLRTLRLALSALPALAASLDGCRSSLLVAVRANVGHPSFASLENVLRRVLEDDPLGSAAALRGEAAAGGGFDDYDDEDGDDDDAAGEEGGRKQRDGEEELEEDEGDGDFDDDDGGDDARTQATSSRSARPLRRRRSNNSSRQASKRVS